MFAYNTLESTSMEELHKTFLEAFSDYQVKLDLPLAKLQQMLQRRGYVPQASLGAFINDAIVGFVLNGIRNWDGKFTAYDTGTAVIEAYRKQGITSHMLLKIKPLLREMGVEQYLLEVIQTNASAVQLYKKEGFEIIREFECFNLVKNKSNPLTSHKVEHINAITESRWKELMKFWDFKPSWQNSMDSVNAVSNAFIYSAISINDAIAGYGIIDKKSGDIPQIAVDKNYRGKGIGRSILADLINTAESENINVINVDSQSSSMKDFLLKFGFQHKISQYEMILKMDK